MLQKSTNISLSRLAITGLVTASTPAVVLKDIADAHSIICDESRMNSSKYIIQLINAINTKDVNVVKKHTNVPTSGAVPESLKQQYEPNQYKLIARFVNKNCRWKEQSLLRAFDKMSEYFKLDKLTEVHVGFKFGPQTPEQPDNLNACVLYGICKANRINTRFDSTIDEMASNIEMLFSLRNPEISRTIRMGIYESMMYGDCEGYQLVNMLSQIDPDRAVRIMNLTHISFGDRQNGNHTVTTSDNNVIIPINEIIINYESLRAAASDIRVRNIRIKPRTHVEAVAMAAIYYKMDISQVRNPLAEYQELTRTPYFPLDRYMAERLQTSNRYFDSILNPRLDKIFNPELPSNLYEDGDLDAMCVEEGYQLEAIRDEGPYTVLQTCYFLPTFLHGKQGNISNTINTDLDELHELSYDNVVVYGVRGNDMVFYTYGELAATFKTLKRFQRPDGNNELYSDIAIRKLYHLCQKDQRVGESQELFHERLELAEEIDRLKLYLEANQGPARVFLDKYDILSLNDKNMVKNVLTQLLHCAMYMRGWNGTGSFPLTSDAAAVEYDEQRNVDVRVTDSIAQLENMINDLNILHSGTVSSDAGMGDAFKILPLIFYHQQSGELRPSTNEEEGLTIYERINIVRGGENGSIQSCIRMSSNRFAASAYYYMRLIGMPLPFNISDMSHIM